MMHGDEGHLTLDIEAQRDQSAYAPVDVEMTAAALIHTLALRVSEGGSRKAEHLDLTAMGVAA